MQYWLKTACFRGRVISSVFANTGVRVLVVTEANVLPLDVTVQFSGIEHLPVAMFKGKSGEAMAAAVAESWDVNHDRNITVGRIRTGIGLI